MTVAGHGGYSFDEWEQWDPKLLNVSVWDPGTKRKGSPLCLPWEEPLALQIEKNIMK